MFDCQPGARAVRGSWLSAQPLPLTPLAKEEEVVEEEEGEEGETREWERKEGKKKTTPWYPTSLSPEPHPAHFAVL